MVLDTKETTGLIKKELKISMKIYGRAEVFALYPAPHNLPSPRSNLYTEYGVIPTLSTTVVAPKRQM